MSTGASLGDISRRNPQEDFELLARIGSGTYGDVYKAKHTTTGELSAVKIIKIEPGDEFNLIKQEIDMLKDNEHKNIVKYFGSYLRMQKLWIAMEYCGGGSIQDIYHITGPLAEKQIAYVCRETLRGLGYLHRKSIMHRDIKGANILLTNTGDIKLADFGVSAQITQTIGKRKSFIGTPYWMAPEVAAVERKGGYDVKCDVWAVGITGIEMAELQPPNFDLHPMRALFLMSQRSFKSPKLKDQSRNKWSKEFHDFIKVSLTKSSRSRPTAEQLLRHSFVIQAGLSSNLCAELIEKSRNPSRPQRADELDEEDHDIVGPISVKGSGGKDLESPEAAPPTKEEINELGDRLSNSASVSSTNDAQATLVRPISREVKDYENTLIRPVSRAAGATASAAPPARPSKLPAPAIPAGPSVPPRQHHKPSQQAPPIPATKTNSSEAPVRPQHRKRTNSASTDSGNSVVTPTNPAPQVPARARPPKPPPPNTTSSKNSANGMLLQPKVHMGAGLSKIFNGCPLEINCATSWTHPETEEQYILFGCNEGLYYLNLGLLHEEEMVRLLQRKISWMIIWDNILITLTGKKNPQLYSHDLATLIDKTAKATIARIPSVISRRFSVTRSIPDTKGCIKCDHVRNAGDIYLVAATHHSIILLQWHDMLRRFVIFKQVDMAVPEHSPFRLVISSPDNSSGSLPSVLVGVSAPTTRDTNFHVHLVDLNLANPEIVIDEDHLLPVSIAKQLEYDTLVIGFDRFIKIVSKRGVLKPTRKLRSEITFDFELQDAVCLPDSVLGFHSHGLQGRSYRDETITQELNDPNKNFKLLCGQGVIVLETKTAVTQTSDIWLVTGCGP